MSSEAPQTQQLGPAYSANFVRAQAQALRRAAAAALGG